MWADMCPWRMLLLKCPMVWLKTALFLCVTIAPLSGWCFTAIVTSQVGRSVSLCCSTFLLLHVCSQGIICAKLDAFCSGSRRLHWELIPSIRMYVCMIHVVVKFESYAKITCAKVIGRIGRSRDSAFMSYASLLRRPLVCKKFARRMQLSFSRIFKNEKVSDGNLAAAE